MTEPENAAAPQTHMHSPRRRRIALLVARTGIMTAIVTIGTSLVQIYNPITRGNLNFGDIMVFVGALTFGSGVGGFAGGVGSAISDALSGYGYFAPFTLVIKGLEGVTAGLISNRNRAWRDVIAVSFAGLVMVVGYFLAEFFPLQLGWAALAEVPGNIIQIVVGAVIGVPLAIVLRRSLPEGWWK